MKKIVLLAFVLVLLLTAVVWEFTGLSVAHTNDNNSSYGDGKFVFASSKTIWVPDNFTSIQEAINNASEGDTIFVRADTYYEHVTIDKSISLIGENRSNTIIDGSGTGTIITVSDVNNVAIEELTVQNGEEGIFLVNTRNITLARNDIRNNQYNFFVAGGTEGPDPQYFVHNIDSSNTVDGKPVYYWVGVNNDTIPQDAGFVALVNSTNITVQNLSLSNNGEGLLLVNTNASTILHNEINNCVVGLALGMCYNNTIVGNTIANSQDLCGNFYGFANNVLYHNNFLNSSLIVYYDMGNNKWDNGYPSGGNYWSDYTDVDEKSGPNQDQPDSDGIWDHPYVIDSNNRDRYPLIGVWVDVEPPNADAGPDQSVFKGMTVTFDGSNSTDNIGIASYTWSFIDITLKTMTGMQPKYTFNNVGDFEVTLNVSDYAGYWDTDTMWVHVLSDTTKPSIGTVSQEPEVPDDGEKVTITVDVTDEESGVHNVTLSYSTDGGETWNNVTMEKTTGDTYEGEIPGLPAETNVQYKIIAYDKAGNFKVDDQLGQYYVYTVIPEFPTWTSTLLILIVLTLAIAIYKRRLLKTPIH